LLYPLDPRALDVSQSPLHHGGEGLHHHLLDVEEPALHVPLAFALVHVDWLEKVDYLFLGGDHTDHLLPLCEL